MAFMAVYFAFCIQEIQHEIEMNKNASDLSSEEYILDLPLRPAQTHVIVSKQVTSVAY